MSPQMPLGTRQLAVHPPGTVTFPHPSLTAPGPHLVPSPKQQLWDNTGTTAQVPLSTLVPPTVHARQVQNLSREVLGGVLCFMPVHLQSPAPKDRGQPPASQPVVLLAGTSSAAASLSLLLSPTLSEAPSPCWSPSHHHAQFPLADLFAVSTASQEHMDKQSRTLCKTQVNREKNSL